MAGKGERSREKSDGRMRRVKGAEGKKNRIRCEEREEKDLTFRRIGCGLTAMVTTVLSANAVITTFCKMFS